MTINIRIETFKQTGTYTAPSGTVYETGTVEVEYGRETITTEAARRDDGEHVSAAGFVGRYHTSNKAWRAHVYRSADRDYTQATFGRDDRSARFNKMQGISYEPEAFWKDHPNPAFYGR